MKQIFFLMIFAVAAFAQYGSSYGDNSLYAPAPEDVQSQEESVYDQPSQSTYLQQQPVASTPAPGAYYNGFYMDFTLAFMISHLENKETEYDYYSDSPRIEEHDFSGFGPAFNFKIGGIIKSLIAAHATIDLALGNGTHEYRENGLLFKDNNATQFRFFIGGGATVYPFRNPESPMNGFFVGASVGYEFSVISFEEYVELDEDGYYDSYGEATGDIGIGLKFEIGKLWSISDRWNIGAVGLFNYDISLLEESANEYDYDYDDEDYSVSSYSFWIGVRIVRK